MCSSLVSKLKVILITFFDELRQDLVDASKLVFYFSSFSIVVIDVVVSVLVLVVVVVIVSQSLLLLFVMIIS